jgi:hypothetical protein
MEIQSSSFERDLLLLCYASILTGHHWQEKTPLAGTAGMQMVMDMRILCEKIISGEITGVPETSGFGGGKIKILTAEYGLAGIWYDPDNIRPAKR